MYTCMHVHAHIHTHPQGHTHTHTYSHMWEALKDLPVAALEKAKCFHDDWKQEVDCRGLHCCGLLMQRRLILKAMCAARDQ